MTGPTRAWALTRWLPLGMEENLVWNLISYFFQSYESYEIKFLNPLSAIWRIYPSSKWSSQWPYDGYIRHGWMRSCGRGRDSATPQCFGRGSQGMIFVRSSKLSLFFPELCSFRRVFCFPHFCKIWRQTFKPWGFWFRRCLGALFENCARSLGIFLRTPTTTTSILWKFLFFFQSRAGVTCLTAMVIPRLSKALLWWFVENWNGNLIFGRWRDRVQKDRRSSSRLVRVACGDPWSKETKARWSQPVITLYRLQNQRGNQQVLRSLFPRPDVSTVLLFAVFLHVAVQQHVRQDADRGQRRKAVIRDTSGVDHRAVTILSAPIWFTGRRHCTVFRHVMLLSLSVLR